MNKNKMFILYLASILICVLSQKAMSKTLTKDQLIKIGGESIECTVKKVGVYNFIATTFDGVEFNFHTNSGTIQFVPKNERLVKGDKINVVYFGPISASKSVDKKFAVLVEFIDKKPRNFITGSQTCITAYPRFRNGGTIYLPELGKLIQVEGILPPPGTKIKVRLHTVPARIGNGYVYKALD